MPCRRLPSAPYRRFWVVSEQRAIGRKMLSLLARQENKLALETVRKRAGVPESNHLFNVDWFGNSGASGATSVLS